MSWNAKGDPAQDTGSSCFKLVFPPEIQRIPTAAKAIKGIDCDLVGIATVDVSLYASSEDLLVEKSWPCSARKGTVTNVPAGSGIRAVVNAKKENGTILLQGEKEGFTVIANQETSAGEIEMDYFMPQVRIGDHPKILSFDWQHLAFPPLTDHFRLEVDPDGSGKFDTVQGAEHITAFNHTFFIPLHLVNWANAGYRVAALNESNQTVTASDTVDLLTSVEPEKMIGYLKAGNSDGDDLFGYQLALSDDGRTLAVGAHGESSDARVINGDQTNNNADDAGAVYVYIRSEDGSWRQQAYLKAGNADINDEFGESVSLSADGNLLAAGARQEDSGNLDPGNNALENSGAVYLFARNSSGYWHQEAYLKSSNSDAGDLFGSHVALSADGRFLAISSVYEDSGSADPADNNTLDAGAVYIFSRDGDASWREEAYIKADYPDAEDSFDREVAMSYDGGTMVVATSRQDGNTGGIYVFTRAQSGQWFQEAYIRADNTAVGDEFGFSVSLSADGNLIAVGARREESNHMDSENNHAEDAGAAYLFRRAAGVGWQQEAYLKAGNSGAGDLFGHDISLSSDGNYLAVGAFNEAGRGTGLSADENDDNAPEAGAVYVFARLSDGTWQQKSYLKAPNTDTGDRFGWQVGLSSNGDVLAVGGVYESSGSNEINGDQSDNSAGQAGAVYLY